MYKRLNPEFKRQLNKLNQKSLNSLLSKRSSKQLNSIFSGMNEISLNILFSKVNPKSLERLLNKLNPVSLSSLLSKLKEKTVRRLLYKLNQKTIRRLLNKLSYKSFIGLLSKLSPESLNILINELSPESLISQINKLNLEQIVSILSPKSLMDLPIKLNSEQRHTLLSKLNFETINSLFNAVSEILNIKLNSDMKNDYSVQRDVITDYLKSLQLSGDVVSRVTRLYVSHHTLLAVSNLYKRSEAANKLLIDIDTTATNHPDIIASTSHHTTTNPATPSSSDVRVTSDTTPTIITGTTQGELNIANDQIEIWDDTITVMSELLKLESERHLTQVQRDKIIKLQEISYTMKSSGLSHNFLSTCRHIQKRTMAITRLKELTQLSPITSAIMKTGLIQHMSYLSPGNIKPDNILPSDMTLVNSTSGRSAPGYITPDWRGLMNRYVRARPDDLVLYRITEVETGTLYNRVSGIIITIYNIYRSGRVSVGEDGGRWKNYICQLLEKIRDRTDVPTGWYISGYVYMFTFLSPDDRLTQQCLDLYTGRGSDQTEIRECLNLVPDLIRSINQSTENTDIPAEVVQIIEKNIKPEVDIIEPLPDKLETMVRPWWLDCEKPMMHQPPKPDTELRPLNQTQEVSDSTLRQSNEMSESDGEHRPSTGNQESSSSNISTVTRPSDYVYTPSIVTREQCEPQVPTMNQTEAVGFITNTDLSSLPTLHTLPAPDTQRNGGTNPPKLEKNRKYHGRCFLYHELSDTFEWRNCRVIVGEKLNVDQEGSFRDVYRINLDGAWGNNQLVLKIYKNIDDHEWERYKRTAEIHMVSLYYIKSFQQSMDRISVNKDCIVILDMMAVKVLVLFENARSGRVVQFGAVEGLVDQKFYRFTNNTAHCKKELKDKIPIIFDILFAFGHFTYQQSGSRLLVTDFQGWIYISPGGCLQVSLTDPAVHTEIRRLCGGWENHGVRGMRIFFSRVHPECNDYCRALGLHRDNLP